MSAMVPNIGDIVADKYRIERKLGGGGMGTVFAATHLMTGRRFAVKWMNTRAVQDSAARERFIREFQAAGAIDHANVVAVLDAGSQDGSLYIVMEYLEGESLARKIARGPMAPDECVPIVVEAMRGVAAAHRLDIVHRDLKPDNIFVCDGPERTGLTVKVLDFGVMKPVNARAQELPTITARGMAVGTPPYMAPEQVLALQSIDHRVDIYAFGVILYEALSGRLPFADATGLVLLERIVRGGAPALSKFVPGVPIGLEATVMRALSRDPRRRFQQLADFAACLRPWAAGAGTFSAMAPAPRRHALGSGAERPDGSFLALHSPAGSEVTADVTPPEGRRVIEAVVLDSHASASQPSVAEEPAPHELEAESRAELPIEAALRRALARESRLPQRHSWNAPDADGSGEASHEESSADAAGAQRESEPGEAEESAAAAPSDDAFTRGVRGEREPVAALPVPRSARDDARRSRVPTLPLRLQDIDDALRVRFQAKPEPEEESAADTAITTQLAAPRRSRVSMYDVSPWPEDSAGDVWSAPTEMAVPAPRMPAMRNRTGWALVAGATLIVAGIASLLWWDEEHFDEAEQSTSAVTDIFSNPDPGGGFDDFDPASAEPPLRAAPPTERASAAAEALPPVNEVAHNEARFEVATGEQARDEEARYADAAAVVSPRAVPQPVAEVAEVESAATVPATLASEAQAANVSLATDAPEASTVPEAPASVASALPASTEAEGTVPARESSLTTPGVISTATPEAAVSATNAPAPETADAARAAPASQLPAAPATQLPTAQANTMRAARASSATPTSASTSTRAATSGGARGTTAAASAPTAASVPATAPFEVVPASQPVAARAPIPQRDVVLLAASPTPNAQAAPSINATSMSAETNAPIERTQYTFAGPAPLIESTPGPDAATRTSAATASAPIAGAQPPADERANARRADTPTAVPNAPVHPNPSARPASSEHALNANAQRSATSSAPTADPQRAASSPAPTANAARAASSPSPAASSARTSGPSQTAREAAPAPGASAAAVASTARPATRPTEAAGKPAPASSVAAHTPKPNGAPAPRIAANVAANSRAQNSNTRANSAAATKPIVLRAPGATITITELDVTPPAAPAPKKAAVDVPTSSAAASGSAKPAPARAPRKTSGVSMTDF
jgi:tRNA A-37 threonylcarbamoyl transferase component Bud32